MGSVAAESERNHGYPRCPGLRTFRHLTGRLDTDGTSGNNSPAMILITSDKNRWTTDALPPARVFARSWEVWMGSAGLTRKTEQMIRPKKVDRANADVVNESQ